jgi:hypothetical protein
VAKTLYDVLQVTPNAEPEIIKTAYNSLMQRFYPVGSARDPNDDFLKTLNRAYEILSDPAKRAGYDAALTAPGSDAGIGQAIPTQKSTPLSEPDACSKASAGDLNKSGGVTFVTAESETDYYEAAIGEKNIDYYLNRFERFDHGGSKASWNWFAFLFPVFWAAYRKMGVWSVAFIILTGLTNGIAKGGGGEGLALFLILTAQAAFGFFANYLYYKNIKKKIAVAQASSSHNPNRLAYLQRKGGVNLWVGAIVPIVGILAAIALIALIALPAYHDYSQRARAQQYGPAEQTGSRGAQKELDMSSADPLGLYSQHPAVKKGDGSQGYTPSGPEVDATLRYAISGDAKAQHVLGIMYLNGQGVPQDYAQALYWYRKAAEQGDADTQSSLGFMYRVGRGVPQDYAQALYWFRKAAEQGDANGQYSLGFMLKEGQGAPIDYVQAYMWFNLAVASGSQGDAALNLVWANNRSSLASLMTPAQIEQAQSMTRDWLASHKR